MQRWPLHPKPGEYEMLIPWLRRIAETYEINFKIFCRSFLDLDPSLANSIYYQPPESVLLTISIGTGVPIEKLKTMTPKETFQRIEREITLFLEEHPNFFEEWSQRLKY